MVLIRTGRAVLLGAFALVAMVAEAGAICCPFPPVGSSLEASGQTNFVVVDDEASRITVIANVGLAGSGRTFSLILPTPTEPTLAPASSDIWRQTERIMRAAGAVRPSDGTPFGCGPTVLASPEESTGAAGDVVIHGEEVVGAFDATVLTATSATALVDWLEANAFAYSAADSSAFAPYIERDWFFTAMMLDSSRVALPVPSWDVSLDPVAVTFDAKTLEVPLSILSVNRAPSFRVTFFVVADRRMALPGFDTPYANEISRRELAAMHDEAPAVAAHVDEGDVLVRLVRRFDPSDPMETSIELVASASDAEVFPGFARRAAISDAPLVAAHARGWNVGAQRRPPTPVSAGASSISMKLVRSQLASGST